MEDCVAPVSGDISRRSFSRRGQEREGEGGGGGPIWLYIWVRPYARPEGGQKTGVSNGEGEASLQEKGELQKERKNRGRPINVTLLTFASAFAILSAGYERNERIKCIFLPFLTLPHIFFYASIFGRVSLHLRPLFASEEEHFPSE